MKKKILIIEDNHDIRENTAELLMLYDYNVFTARNGILGFELAKAVNPDLIICDILMPEMDGFQVLKKLQQHAGLSCIPFIFLSALTDKSDVNTGMGLGADDYVSKPFEPSYLISLIERRLKKAASIFDYNH